MPKFIRYTAPDGTTAECHPIPNARLIRMDGEVFPLFRVDRRGNPPLPEGAKWAESADQFIDRVMRSDVPDGATNVEIVEA